MGHTVVPRSSSFDDGILGRLEVCLGLLLLLVVVAAVDDRHVLVDSLVINLVDIVALCRLGLVRIRAVDLASPGVVMLEQKKTEDAKERKPECHAQLNERNYRQSAPNARTVESETTAS